MGTHTIRVDGAGWTRKHTGSQDGESGDGRVERDSGDLENVRWPQRILILLLWKTLWCAVSWCNRVLFYVNYMECRAQFWKSGVWAPWEVVHCPRKTWAGDDYQATTEWKTLQSEARIKVLWGIATVEHIREGRSSQRRGKSSGHKARAEGKLRKGWKGWVMMAQD